MILVNDMEVFKRKYWWLWLILFLFSGGMAAVFLAFSLDLFEEDAWYANSKNWLIAFCMLFVPFFIMGIVFTIDMTIQVAAKLELPGKEIYLSPFIWLLCLIIPFLGWIALVVLGFYLEIGILVMIAHGKAEQSIENIEK